MRRRSILTGLLLPATASAQRPPVLDRLREGPPSPEEVRRQIKTRLEHLREFRDSLRAFLADLPALEFARRFRELEYRHPGLSGLRASVQPSGKLFMHAAETTVPDAPAATSLSISQDATNLITGFEVGSASLYTQRYQSPVWPGGNSGVTIGIGYDLGYCSTAAFTRDWQGILPDPHQGALSPTCTAKADKAQPLVAQPEIKAVKVSWDQASRQFARFLPQVINETAAAFPNCAALPADSLGALVSLVYNRGSDTSASKPNRAEMATIKQLMAASNFAAVPEQIRAMKRLWPTVPGLMQRRELEAKLFETGLAP